MPVKVVLSILPQVAISQLCHVFAPLEARGIGLTFDRADFEIGNYRYDYGLMMLCISFVFFIVLALYIDAVLPKEHTTSKPVCFCVASCCRTRQRTHEDIWFSQVQQERRQTLQNMSSLLTVASVADPFEIKYMDEGNYEGVSPEVASLEL